MANKRTWKPVEIFRKIETKEMFECEVKDFGTNSGHIPFSGRYVGQRVLVIPMRRKR